MKKWIAALMMGALLAMSSVSAFAMGEKTTTYDMAVRIVFGFGHGKKAVREEDFGKFLRTVAATALKDAFCTFEAQGQWVHPERGLIREKNMVILVDMEKSAESEAAIKRVAEEYLRAFPGSNAAVYVVESPVSSAKIYF